MEPHTQIPNFGFGTCFYRGTAAFPSLPISKDLLRGMWKSYRFYQKEEEESLFCTMLDELCSYNQWLSNGLKEDSLLACFWREQIQTMADTLEDQQSMRVLLQENPIDFCYPAAMPKNTNCMLHGITLSTLLISTAYQLFYDIDQWVDMIYQIKNPECIDFNLDEIKDIDIPDMRQLFHFHFQFAQEEIRDFSFENDDTQEVTLSENEWKSRLSYTLYCQECRELKCIQNNLFPYMQPAAVAKLQKIANLYLEYLKNSIKPQERPIEPKRTAQTLSTDVPLPREVIAEGYQTSVKRAFADCKTDFEIGKTLHELQCKGWLTNDKPRKAYYRFIREFCYKRFDDSNADKGYRSI